MTASVLAIPHGLADDALPTLLAQPAQVLADGGLVAFPTETVYGLGANAMSADAVARIFTAKGRPDDNPLIVHLADASWIEQVAVPTPLALALAEQHWPGPLTLVLDRLPDVPDATTAGLDSIAVRVPASPIAQALIRQAGVPIAAPSANISGSPSPTAAAHVAADLGEAIDWIIDGGPCTVGIESTVVDARGTSPLILREGAITREMLGATRTATDSERSPGTRHRHYQPQARVQIAPAGRGVEIAAGIADAGVLVGVVASGADRVDYRGPGPRRDGGHLHVLGTPTDADELGRQLYAALRRADEMHLAVVVIEGVGETGVGRAVMDRLRRAADADGPT